MSAPLERLEIEESIIARIRERREAGRAKYGTTMERTDLTRADWLRHAQEEALDLAIYLERLSREETGADECDHLRDRNAALKACLADAITLYQSPSATTSSWAAWAERARGLIQPHELDYPQTIGDTP